MENQRQLGSATSAPAFLNIKQFAARMGVHRHTVRAWIKRGMPILRRERTTRIDLEKAAAWLATAPKPPSEKSAPARQGEQPLKIGKLSREQRVPTFMSR